jgi:ADP-ribose pyrophosphatase YjhB (NUDIX family)
MGDERFRLKAGSHLLLMKGRKVLLIRRRNTGYGDGKYSLVAGHLDPDESMRENMVREAREEVGIRIRKDDLRFMHVMHKIDKEGGLLVFFWKATRWGGTPKNNEPDKCSEIRWFDMGRLPRDLLPQTRFVLASIKKGRQYSEYIGK